MAANHSILPNSHGRPELVPFMRESQSPSEKTEGVSESNAESITVARNFLGAIDFEVTAIDFEVAAALSLSPAWRAESQSDVYLVRTLERIAGHMKALQDIQAALSPSHYEGSHPDLYVINRPK